MIPPLRDMLSSTQNLYQKLLDMYDRLEPLMKEMPASIGKHHSEVGGYYRHVQEVVYYALKIREMMAKDKSPNVPSEYDIILVAFIHDLDKLERYKRNDGNFVIINPNPKLRNDQKTKWFKPPFMYNTELPVFESSAYVANQCAPFGIRLTNDHLHALAMHHGGWSEYASRARNGISPMATILHSADLLSAFIRGDLEDNTSKA